MATAVPSSTSYTPGNLNAATMIRHVLNFVSSVGDSDLNTLAREGLNQGIDRINSVTWNKIYGIQTITLVADDDDYSVSSDHKDPIRLLRMRSGVRDGRIPYKFHQTFFNEHPNAINSGYPNRYTIDYKQRLLVLSRPPTSSYVTTWATLEYWYHRRLARLTQNSDTIDIPPEFEWFLIWTARMEVASDLYPEKSLLAERRVEALWRELRNQDFETETDWSTE